MSPGSDVMIWSPWSARATSAASIASARPQRGEQDPGASSESGVEGHDLDGLQRRGEARLAACSTPPHLGDHAPVGPRRALGLKGALEAPPHPAVVALERDERARVQDLGHPARRAAALSDAAVSRS